MVLFRTLSTPRIIEMYLKVPREDFVLEDMREEAYSDHPLRFSTMGFNTSAPHMYAMCLEALQLAPGESFLDIGCGCGQLTLIGGLLVGKEGISLGLDVRKDIVELSEGNVNTWKTANPEEEVNVKFELRNCFLIDPEARKWDCIHVGACCPEFRLQFLFDLLKPNGRLVTPYGDQLLLAKKSSDGKEITKKTLADVRYGDLIVPSEAEVREAILLAESKKRERIQVPKSISFDDSASSLFNSEKHSDFSLVVEGKTIPVHKLILKSRCEHFESMFDAGMKETTSTQLVIDDFSYSQVIAAIEVIYTGKCFIDASNAVELLEIADFYKLEWMKCQCEKVLHENIEVITAAQLLSIADRFNAPQLRAAALEFVIKNYQEIMMTEGFQQLERELVVEVMKEACQRATFR